MEKEYMRMGRDMKTNITKPEYTAIVRDWLDKYLKEKYSGECEVSVIVPDTDLSRLAIEPIKKVPNYSTFEFAPDVLGIMIHKNTREPKLVFLNRSVNAISLKEIGEMYCYCKLADPFLAFIVSPKGLPNEVNLLLLNKNIENKLLSYSTGKSIVLFRLDEKTKKVDELSVYPVNKRKLL